MKNIATLLLLFAVVSGCDKNAASKPNIESGLNHYLARLEACPNYWPSAFPAVVTDGPQSAALDALTAAGLVSKSTAQADAQGRPRTTYALTDKGRNSGFDGAKPLHSGQTRLFCFGKLQVKEVLNFTLPAEAEGVRQTRVQYTVELAHSPSWVNMPDIQKVFRNLTPEAFSKAPPRDAIMALTNNGWRVSDDL